MAVLARQRRDCRARQHDAGMVAVVHEQDAHHGRARGGRIERRVAAPRGRDDRDDEYNRQDRKREADASRELAHALTRRP